MVNNICIRKEKAVRVYVDVIAKTFEENSEITQGGGRGGVGRGSWMPMKDV